MKLYALLTISCLALLSFVSGCKKAEEEMQAPVITISDEFAEVENFNVGEEVRIAVNVKSPIGIKRLAYYFIHKTANGTESGTPVYIDKTDYPQEVNEEIVFKVQENMVELVIISFDKLHHNSEIHIVPKNIRAIPALAFKDDIKYRETLFENKQLSVEGTITSEFDLTSVSYQTIINGVTSDETAITITDPKNMPFAVNVVVPKNMTGIIIKAENTYEGLRVDTFKIGNVVDDDVAVTLEGGNTDIPIAYVGIDNTLAGMVASGSAVSGLTYAIKTNGVYGAETPIPVGTPKDEFPFSIRFPVSKGIEALRITGQNEGGKTKVEEYLVKKVYNKLIHFASIKLTTEIGAGKNNWFSAYQAPHVFEAANAAPHQLMLDFVLGVYKGDVRIMPAAVFAAGTAYKDAMAPYMPGFTKATYTMVTANRRSVTPAAFNSIEWDGELTEFLETKIKAPQSAGGEGYNINTTNRRISGDLKAGEGLIIGWGQWNPKVENKVFGLVLVKEYAVTDGVATVTLEIKVPDEDNRTKYNPASLFDYLP